MARVCPDICVNLGSTTIELSDVTGIYAVGTNTLGWKYDPSDPAVSTADIATSTLTLSRGDSSWVFNIPPSNYSDPASPKMDVLEAPISDVTGLSLIDGLYNALYALTFTDNEVDCADDTEQIILYTRNLEACMTKLWTSIVKDCAPDITMKGRYDELCMELYALKAGVNCGNISTDDEVQEIITDLAARCAALSQECNC